MDTVDKKTRSRIMAAVGQKNTKPEMLLRKALHRKGFRYVLNDKRLPGSPDLVLPKYQTVIFVHGCFWHGCSTCKRNISPSSNAKYWKNKIDNNRKRDRRNTRVLRQKGWIVLRIWEHQINKRPDYVIRRIRNTFNFQ